MSKSARLAQLVAFQPCVQDFSGLISRSVRFSYKLSVTSDKMNMDYWLTAKVKPLRESVVRITDHPNMT